MSTNAVRLSVPAQAEYARVVRMTASNLAVLAGLGVDEVEDVRMAAEEGFVYTCATAPQACDASFTFSHDEVRIDFTLGELDAADDENTDLTLIEAMLSAVCDDYGFSDDGMSLVLIKRAGSHAE